MSFTSSLRLQFFSIMGSVEDERTFSTLTFMKNSAYKQHEGSCRLGHEDVLSAILEAR